MLIQDQILYLFNRLALDPNTGQSLLKMSIDIEPPVPSSSTY
jgi:hypothetical protein